MKPLTWDRGYDNVLGQGYRTPREAVIDEYGAGANRKIWRTTCSSTTFSTKNLTWSHLGLKSGLRGEMPVGRAVLLRPALTNFSARAITAVVADLNLQVCLYTGRSSSICIQQPTSFPLQSCWNAVGLFAVTACSGNWRADTTDEPWCDVINGIHS
jgi:hypothetical protein